MSRFEQFEVIAFQTCNQLRDDITAFLGLKNFDLLPDKDNRLTQQYKDFTLQS